MENPDSPGRDFPSLMFPLKPTDSDLDRARIRALPWCVASGMCNSVFALWTFGGTVFLLFLSELGLPKNQIGTLLSFFPFCGVLALFFAPYATRLGWKRVFIAFYSARKITISLLLLLPWIIAYAGRPTAIVFLFCVMITFAVLRALAETGYYPWSQEFLPDRVRGQFSAVSTVAQMIASSAALLIASHVIGTGSGFPRFLFLLSIGCVIGLIGVACMAGIPGGRPTAASSESRTHLASMKEAMRDRNFVTFLAGQAGFAIGVMMLTSFLPLYLKEFMGISAGAVIRLDIVLMLGGAVGSIFCGWIADRAGSRPVLMPTAMATLLIPLAWIFLPPRIPHPAFWCGAIYFIYGAAAGGMVLSSLRLLFNGVVPREKSPAYMGIFYAWNGVTGGISPLVAGWILSWSGNWRTKIGYMSFNAHGILFVVSFAALLAALVLFGRVTPDGAHTTRTAMRRVLSRLSEVRTPWGM